MNAEVAEGSRWRRARQREDGFEYGGEIMFFVGRGFWREDVRSVTLAAKYTI